jgi:hypothetical protein
MTALHSSNKSRQIVPPTTTTMDHDNDDDQSKPDTGLKTEDIEKALCKYKAKGQVTKEVADRLPVIEKMPAEPPSNFNSGVSLPTSPVASRSGRIDPPNNGKFAHLIIFATRLLIYCTNVARNSLWPEHQLRIRSTIPKQYLEPAYSSFCMYSHLLTKVC